MSNENATDISNKNVIEINAMQIGSLSELLNTPEAVTKVLNTLSWGVAAARKAVDTKSKNGTSVREREKDLGYKCSIYSTHVSIKSGKFEKDISIRDFHKIIEEISGAATEKTIVGFQLPYGCMSFGKSSSSIQLSCYYPEQRREIIYEKRDRNYNKVLTNYTIPFPNMVISHTLKDTNGFWVLDGYSKYYITHKKVGQLTGEFVASKSNEDGFFHTPFPNFYDSGNMCFGGNSMPIKFSNNLRGLDYYYQVIFNSPFNDDLGVRGVVGSPSVKDWFAELSKLEEFPYNRIIGCKG